MCARYNIGPAQRVPVILVTAEGVKAVEMRWGMSRSPVAWAILGVSQSSGLLNENI